MVVFSVLIMTVGLQMGWGVSQIRIGIRRRSCGGVGQLEGIKDKASQAPSCELGNLTRTNPHIDD